MMRNSNFKPCPSCHIPIERAYGCNLMWCTQCHISFNWSTGKEVRIKNNHNPHYIEWAQANGVNQQDLQQSNQAQTQAGATRFTTRQYGY